MPLNHPQRAKLLAALRRVHRFDDASQRLPLAERKPMRMAGMRPARILAPVFVANDPKNAEMSKMMLAGGVFGLMLQNIAYLRAHPETPNLYDSGVTYKPERRRVDPKTARPLEYGEEWQTIPWVIYRGYGDCEDLGAWRAAELRVKHGIPANPFIKARRMPSGYWRAHVVVRWPSGELEDPSAKLGMYTFRY